MILAVVLFAIAAVFGFGTICSVPTDPISAFVGLLITVALVCCGIGAL